jgi:hypothetical protein
MSKLRELRAGDKTVSSQNGSKDKGGRADEHKNNLEDSVESFLRGNVSVQAISVLPIPEIPPLSG